MRHSLVLLTLLPVLALANPPRPGDFPGDFPPEDMPHRPPGHHPGGDGDKRLPPFLHDIDLSEQQQSQIKNLVDAQRNALKAKWHDERKIRSELERLSFSGDYSEAKAQALIEKSLAVHREIALQKSRLDNAVFKLLTPEQQQKLPACRPK
ncbi:MAG: Spy/CpxP family protein refolding chaperone [Gammaproteobacteria bacterium]